MVEDYWKKVGAAKWEKYKYGSFWDWLIIYKSVGGYTIRNFKGAIKTFKTKSQALKFAKSYMRTH
jgi:hypothetical protein